MSKHLRNTHTFHVHFAGERTSERGKIQALPSGGYLRTKRRRYGPTVRAVIDGVSDLLSQVRNTGPCLFLGWNHSG